jgi:flagellar hook-associated protein 1 FlgK
MSGLYGTLELGQRAVQTQRQGIELAGHNIANVDNPAFARQRIDVATGPAIVTPDGIQSGGVTTEQVRQIRNEILDTNIQQENSLTSFLETKNEILELTKAKLGQTFLADLSNGSGDQLSGLATHLNGLFTGFQELANDVTSRSQRVALVDQAENLTQDFNQLEQRLGEVRSQIEIEMANTVDEGNHLLNDITRLNQSIEQAENRSNATANDLRDRRTSKLEELAKITHFQTTTSDNGILSLHLEGETMVDGGQLMGTLELMPDEAGNLQAVLNANNVQKPVTQGRLGALTSVRDETLSPLSNRLDQLASQIVTQVNDIHRNGFDLHGGSGEDFFTGNSAATLRVNQNLIDNPDQVQASGEQGAVGNTDILRAIGGLAGSAQAGLDDLTFATHFTESVGIFTEELADARSQLEDQTAIQDLMNRQRNAVSGVSLDEEMTNLIKYQNAFEASARLVSVIDEMLQTVVNLGR